METCSSVKIRYDAFMSEQPSGFLLINKPAGITSHDVIDDLRRKTGIKRIGHAGTLDPFATGLLLVAVGRSATKHLQQLVGHDKTYEATFVLGATTSTLDPESEIIQGEPFTKPEALIKEAASKLIGAIDQIPPMHSAIKVGGKKLYQLARKGVEIERKPRRVTVHTFDITHFDPQKNGTMEVDVLISCSSGTYIRSLARDLGANLGSTGYVKRLKRTHVGSFSLNESTDLTDLTSNNWLTFLKTPEEMHIDAP